MSRPAQQLTVEFLAKLGTSSCLCPSQYLQVHKVLAVRHADVLSQIHAYIVVCSPHLPIACQSMNCGIQGYRVHA